MDIPLREDTYRPVKKKLQHFNQTEEYQAMKRTRRSFLKTTSASISAPFVGWASTASGQSPAKDLRVASFGAAHRAWSDIEGITRVPNTTLVAVAEVDENHLKFVNRDFPKAKIYRDFRKLIETEAKNLDAVVIGAPDHMHAPMAMTAMQAGLHVYCEKPLTRTVHEARALREFAGEKGLVTQMGNQRSQGSTNQSVAAALRSGIVGTVREIHCLQAKTWGSMDPLPAPVSPPPGLDWDLWLGGRPERPFVEKVFHPRNWRSRLGFGCGNLGDMGCHIFHPWFLGLDLDSPLTVEGQGPAPIDEVSWPTAVRAHWEFPGSKLTGGKNFTVTWHDGGQAAPDHVVAAVGGPKNMISSGSIIIGSEGTLVSPHTDSGKVPFFKKGIEQEGAVPILPKAGDHHRNFGDAIRGENDGNLPLSHFGFAGRMTEAVLLGTYAVRLPGKKLLWDAERLQFSNSDEANQLVREPYRKGWEVEGL